MHRYMDFENCISSPNLPQVVCEMITSREN